MECAGHTFDRFDICEAYYVYAMIWHSGQFSPAYAIFGRLSRLHFKPRPSLNSEEDLTENGRMIYDALVNLDQAGRGPETVRDR